MKHFYTIFLCLFLGASGAVTATSAPGFDARRVEVSFKKALVLNSLALGLSFLAKKQPVERARMCTIGSRSLLLGTGWYASKALFSMYYVSKTS